jgi:hypothetical protein
MASAKVSASLRSQFANENPFKRILRLVKTNIAPAEALLAHSCTPAQSAF